MTIPNAELTILDGGLGVGVTPAVAVALIGTSSSGTADTPLVTNDATLLASTFGTGQLVDAGSLIIESGAQVVACKATTGTAGSVGSVTATRVDSSDGTLVVSSSAPNDGYEVIVEIITSTDSVDDGDGAFRYSLDGGDTYSETIAIPDGTSPQSYTIPNTGIQLDFTDGSASPTFEDGDTFSFPCTAPAYTVAAMQSAFDAIVALPDRWRFVWVLGEAADAASSATLVTAVQAKLAAVAASSSQRRYARGLVGCDDSTDAQLKTAFAAVSADRMITAAGFCNYLSTIGGRYLKRSASWPVAQRAGVEAISRDLGRVKSGALPRIAKRADGSSGIYRDENLTPGLTDERFTTLRTIPNKTGYYITEGRLMSDDGSDFNYTQRGFVMDAACEVLYPALATYINDDLRKLPDGTLDPRDANTIQNDLTDQLADAVLRTNPQHVSGIQVVVRRDLPNLPADTLAVKFRIQPKGKARAVDGEVAYTKTLEG